MTASDPGISHRSFGPGAPAALARRSPCNRASARAIVLPIECTASMGRETAMIHHVSIPARDPQHVASVIAELMGGKCVPFGPLEGAYMAISGDAHGTMIEVYPDKATLDIPAKDDQVVFGENREPP